MEIRRENVVFSYGSSYFDGRFALPIGKIPPSNMRKFVNFREKAAKFAKNSNYGFSCLRCCTVQFGTVPKVIPVFGNPGNFVLLWKFREKVEIPIHATGFSVGNALVHWFFPWKFRLFRFFRLFQKFGQLPGTSRQLSRHCGQLAGADRQPIDRSSQLSLEFRQF